MTAYRTAYGIFFLTVAACGGDEFLTARALAPDTGDALAQVGDGDGESSAEDGGRLPVTDAASSSSSSSSGAPSSSSSGGSTSSSSTSSNGSSSGGSTSSSSSSSSGDASTSSSSSSGGASSSGSSTSSSSSGGFHSCTDAAQCPKCNSIMVGAPGCCNALGLCNCPDPGTGVCAVN